MLDKEYEFLSQMYNQVWNNINRHIGISWQLLSVIGATLAIFTLVEKDIVKYEIAILLIIAVCRWAILHLHDAAAWCHRNICISSNIERAILENSSAKKINPFIGELRDPNKLLKHLRIQRQIPYSIVVFSFIYLGYLYQSNECSAGWFYFGAFSTLLFFIDSWNQDKKVKDKNKDFNDAVNSA